MITIGLDFDGTCVTHDYPDIGKDIGSVPVLKKLVAANCKLVLFTMRSDEYLDEAVKWFKRNEIPLHGINHNPDQDSWTNSPKAYAHLYIDDAALGAPLKSNLILSKREFIDWEKAEQMLIARGIIQ